LLSLSGFLFKSKSDPNLDQRIAQLDVRLEEFAVRGLDPGRERDEFAQSLSPVGEFALAAPARDRFMEAELVDRPRSQEEKVLDTLNKKGEMAASRSFAMNQGRGLKDNLVQRATTAQQQPEELARRFRQLAQLEAKQLPTTAVAESVAAPSAPLPGAAPPKLAAKADAKETSPLRPLPPGAAKKAEAPGMRAISTHQFYARREYAYQNVPGTLPDTLLWHPALAVTEGSVQVSFDVPNGPGTYRVLLLGHDATGRLGYYEGRLEVEPVAAR
jgi:polyhydroxyalkanoate synthesis regulator phasin